MCKQSTFPSMIFILETSLMTSLLHLCQYLHSPGSHSDICLNVEDRFFTSKSYIIWDETNKNFHWHMFMFQVYFPANCTPFDHPYKATNTLTFSYSQGVGGASPTLAGSYPCDLVQEWLSFLRRLCSILSPDIWLTPLWIPYPSPIRSPWSKKLFFPLGIC